MIGKNVTIKGTAVQNCLIILTTIKRIVNKEKQNGMMTKQRSKMKGKNTKLP